MIVAASDPRVPLMSGGLVSKRIIGRLAAAGLAAALLLVPTVSPQTARAASFVVNSFGDTPDVSVADGMCADALGLCTLRAAIQQANFNGSATTIGFAIPGSVFSITPATPLP